MSLRIIASCVVVGTVLFHAGSVRAREPLKPLHETIYHTGAIDTVAFSPDGKLLAIGGLSKSSKSEDTVSEVAIWEVRTRKRLSTLAGQKGRLAALAFSPDNKLLASGNGEQVTLWDVVTGKEAAVLKGFPLGAVQLQFSPDGKILAGISRGDDKKTLNQVRFVDAAEWKTRATLDLGTEEAYCFTFSPDGMTLAVGSGDYDRKAEVWTRGHVWVCDSNGANLKKKLEISRSKVSALAFSPDGKTLATGSNIAAPWGWRARSGMGDGVVTLWDVATWKDRARSEKSVAPVESLTFTADGKGLIYATGVIRQSDHPLDAVTVVLGEVFLLNGSTLKPLLREPVRTSYRVWANRYSSKAHLLVTGAANGTDRLKLWELELGQ